MVPLVSSLTGSWKPTHCIIIGATGGLGSAFVDHLVKREGVDCVSCLSRRGSAPVQHPTVRNDIVDYDRPETIVAAAKKTRELAPPDLVIVATGLLHDDIGFTPEKSLRDLDADRLARAYHVNTIGPALAARSFLPLMRRDAKSVFAAVSARVGSISDNQFGGWYGYRAAKAALNQILRTAAIEQARRSQHAIVAGLHPGTVDTPLSKPFQRNVPAGKLFTAAQSTAALLTVIDGLTPRDTGRIFAYDGTEIAP